MPDNTVYTPEFFDRMDQLGRSSANVVAPLLLRLCTVQSVVDIGCGRGAWLSAFREAGVSHVNGIDGPWVNIDQLLIPRECFQSIRLDQLTAASLPDARYDLAICLEVGEHLPTSQSEGLVQSLTTLAPVVLFSAAIPGQEGTDHINEQWPDFWESLFLKHGYTRLDPIRHRIWRDHRVAWYYQQNLYVYVSAETLDSSPVWQEELRLTQSSPLTLIHPKILAPQRSWRHAIGKLRELLKAAIQRRFLPKRSSK